MCFWYVHASFLDCISFLLFFPVLIPSPSSLFQCIHTYSLLFFHLDYKLISTLTIAGKNRINNGNIFNKGRERESFLTSCNCTIHACCYVFIKSWYRTVTASFRGPWESAKAFIRNLTNVSSTFSLFSN